MEVVQISDLVVEVAGVAAGAVERSRPQARCLPNRQMSQLKAEIQFHRRRVWPTTTQNCFFIRFRIEDFG